MNNSQISDRIDRLAAMMSLLDDNTFKIRSFEKAARIVREHEEDMGVLVDEDRLKDVPGIGPTLAYVIMYYAKAGTVGLEQELESELPEGLADLLDLPGLGIHKVKKLWQEYGITNTKSLKNACEVGALSHMKGFGPKLQVKLTEAIDFRARHEKDFYLDIALNAAKQWMEKLNRLPCVVRVELTGKIRRGDRLIQSVELLVEADPESLISEFKTQYDFVQEAPTLLICTDKTGMPIHSWVCESETFAVEQLFRTGGRVFSEKLNQIHGMDLESTIQMVAKDKNTSSEKDLCDLMGIQWIEPELRDAFDHFPTEIKLIEDTDIKGTFHAHSTWSDGRNSLEELAEAARKLGYQYLGISEHSQAAYYANGLKPDRVKAQWELIDQLNNTNSDFHIFKGIEADILQDGSLDYDEELLAGFDFVIASIHSHFHLDSVKQTDRIVRALQSPFTTILGHPTGRMLMARQGYNPDLTTIIDAAAENDKLIEINTTPKRLDLDWHYLKYAREKGVKISIDPDAHSISGLNTVPLGVRMARKGGITAGDVLNTLDINEIASYLKDRRAR
jgi:DNA polymerase (family 10)